MSWTTFGIVGAAFVLVACSKEPPAGSPAGAQASTAQPNSAQAAASPPAMASNAASAEVGKPAPDFALDDLDGKKVRLSSFKGKPVVIEWFNPGCPFVDRSHTKGSLKDVASKHAKNGVVWLAVNSGAAGKQGHGVDANRAGARKYGMEHPILLDETGEVGKKYGATNTPHIYVIDPGGTLVYRGAVDNSPDGEGESPAGGKLVSYVEEALAAVAAGKAPATTETKAYGCGVKYGK